ncbi:hypothetical protein FOL46_000225, partial [Perkinsus olseni]
SNLAQSRRRSDLDHKHGLQHHRLPFLPSQRDAHRHWAEVSSRGPDQEESSHDGFDE